MSKSWSQLDKEMSDLTADDDAARQSYFLAKMALESAAEAASGKVANHFFEVRHVTPQPGNFDAVAVEITKNGARRPLPKKLVVMFGKAGTTFLQITDSDHVSFPNSQMTEEHWLEILRELMEKNVEAVRKLGESKAS